MLQDRLELKNKTLGCLCYPEECRGDVLIGLIKNMNQSNRNLHFYVLSTYILMSDSIFKIILMKTFTCDLCRYHQFAGNARCFQHCQNHSYLDNMIICDHCYVMLNRRPSKTIHNKWCEGVILLKHFYGGFSLLKSSIDTSIT